MVVPRTSAAAPPQRDHALPTAERIATTARRALSATSINTSAGFSTRLPRNSSASGT